MTDEDGLIHFTDLLYGTYYIAETKVPIGYKGNDGLDGQPKKYSVILNENGLSFGEKTDEHSPDEFIFISDTNQLKLKIINPQISNYEFNIIKVGALTGDKIIKSSRFAITDKSGRIINNQIATLKEGEFKFNNNSLGFKSGVYYIKEVQAPEGYTGLSELLKLTLLDTGKIEIEPSQSEKADISVQDNVVQISVRNHQKPMYFYLKKWNEERIFEKAL